MRPQTRTRFLFLHLVWQKHEFKTSNQTENLRSRKYGRSGSNLTLSNLHPRTPLWNPKRFSFVIGIFFSNCFEVKHTYNSSYVLVMTLTLVLPPRPFWKSMEVKLAPCWLNRREQKPEQKRRRRERGRRKS